MSNSLRHKEKQRLAEKESLKQNRVYRNGQHLHSAKKEMELLHPYRPNTNPLTKYSMIEALLAVRGFFGMKVKQ